MTIENSPLQQVIRDAADEYVQRFYTNAPANVRRDIWHTFVVSTGFLAVEAKERHNAQGKKPDEPVLAGELCLLAGFVKFIDALFPTAEDPQVISLLEAFRAGILAASDSQFPSYEWARAAMEVARLDAIKHTPHRN